MRKLFLVLALVLFPQIAAANPCTADGESKYTPISQRYKKGLLFEIKKCGVESNYLLGTMHSDDPKIVEMLDEAFARLVYSRSASFEIKFDAESIQTTLRKMYFPHDSVETLQTVVGTDLYNKFVTIMARVQPDQPEVSFYRMRPWAAAVLIQEPPKKADGLALDIRLQKFAEGRNIPVTGLETAEEQLAIFERIPENKQLEFFKDTVENYDNVEKASKELIDAYMAQDLKKLQELGEKSFRMISDQAFAKQLEQDLVIKRNHKMAKSMKSKLDAGGAFVAVGALHLPGEEGLLKLLEKEGYFINVVEDPDNAMMQ